MLLIGTYANVAPYYIYQASFGSPSNVGAVQNLPAAVLGGNIAPAVASSNLPSRRVYVYSQPVYSVTRLTSTSPGVFGNIVSITGKRRGVHPLSGVNWNVFGPIANFG